MARKSTSNKSGRHRSDGKVRTEKKPARFRTPQTGIGGEANLLDNKPAIVGFVMSVLSCVVHGTWVYIVWDLASSGEAENFDRDSAIAWVLTILIGVGVTLTLISMVVCLRAAVRRRPRRLAVLGFCMSFFVGALGSSIMIFGALRWQAGG